jgi:hypothetical protein
MIWNIGCRKTPGESGCILATDHRDCQQLLIDIRIELEDLQHLFGCLLLGEVRSMAFLPKKFSCPQERRCLLSFPSYLAVLIGEREVKPENTHY